MTLHRRALTVMGAAVLLDMLAAVLYAGAEHITVWLALYWSVATATTVGYGDVTPKTAMGHVLAVVVMLTVIPLVASTFSLITSGLTTNHMKAHSEGLRQRLDHLIRHTSEVPPMEPPTTD